MSYPFLDHNGGYYRVDQEQADREDSTHYSSPDFSTRGPRQALDIEEPRHGAVPAWRELYSSTIGVFRRHCRNHGPSRDDRCQSYRRCRRSDILPTARLLRFLLYVFSAYLMILGVKSFAAKVLTILMPFQPDDIQPILDEWSESYYGAGDILHWPTDALRDIKPVSCHSHNDYWRKVPLLTAIQIGCTSVEADVWLFGDELFVGHTIPSLTKERTLRNLYLDKLVNLLDKQNTNPSIDHREPYVSPAGLFDTDPFQRFVLLIDFKTASESLFPVLESQLHTLREKNYLTYFNGTDIIERPLTIVASGKASFDSVVVNATYRDVFLDAPLEGLADSSSEWHNPNRVDEAGRRVNNELAFGGNVAGLRSSCEGGIVRKRDDEGHDSTAAAAAPQSKPIASTYNKTNSYFASVSFTASIGHVWGSRLSQDQLQIIRAQIRGAHERGLLVRYWGVPYWPLGLRNHIWHILVREGADIISVDDLRGAVWGDWRKNPGWW